MRRPMSIAAVSCLAIGMGLAGCGKKAATLPGDPIDRAATCGVVTAIDARAAAGVKGELPADAQGRIFHYALLAGSTGESYEGAAAQAVFKRMPALFDEVSKEKWQTLPPACAIAFPATRIKAPELPKPPLDAELQCYMLVDFMRKALADQGSAYAEATARYGAQATRLDGKLGPTLKRAGIDGKVLQQRRDAALAAAAKLGAPPEVIAACDRRFG